MKVESIREIDVARLISELDAKVNAKQDDKKNRGRFYEVIVNRQLLIDACDALRHYYKNETEQDATPTEVVAEDVE